MPARLTTEKFVTRARMVHGDRYDYSKVEYTKNNIKVVIVCPQHGDFTQRPYGHMFGYGCPKCGGTCKLTTEEFIARSRAFHGDRYGYDKVVYVDDNTKVIITCPAHGDFTQRPHDHKKYGCYKCGIESRQYQSPSCGGGGGRLTTEEFISRSKAVHGELYCYDKVKYETRRTKVVIACPKHGEFEQEPAVHLGGGGCTKCGKLSTGNKLRSSTLNFIAKARLVHDYYYDYEQVVYHRAHLKVTIICPKHGKFEQRPQSHLSGYGCAKCGKDKYSAALRYSTEEFILAARKTHGASRYDYTKVNYIDANTLITITCKEHGDFEQKPGQHIYGRGCFECGRQTRAVKSSSSLDEFLIKAEKIHGSTYDYSKTTYHDAHTNTTITCRRHGDFEQKPNGHLCGQGCPKCKSSTGEKSIRKWLDDHKFTYNEQARFQSCKNINPLPFDFSVNAPDQRLIEFHGQQHYEPVSFSNNRKDTQAQMEVNLARVQLHDAIKAKWCEDNNVPLLVIPYWDQHRIPELLEEFLGSASLVGAV
jgi:hypothetical protein